MAITPAAKVDSVLFIQNRTSSILPIGSGIKLKAGQTLRATPTQVQDIQQMMPRLRRLQAAGKISIYKEIPGANDVAGQAEILRCGISSTVTVATLYAQPQYANAAGSAADTLGFVMSRPGTLRSLSVMAGTAPGGVTTVTVTVRVNGADTALVAVLTGTATTATKALNIDVKALDKVSVKVVGGAASAAADLMIAVELV